MAVRLTDLDSDFIAPSQSCVNPLFVGSAADAQTKGVAKLSVGVDLGEVSGSGPEVQPNLIKTSAAADRKVAQVSLHDCLACSGCVTSAEAVLVQQQGVEKLLEAIAAKKYVVVTLSLPSLASIAVYFDRSLQETHHKMRNYLKSVGVAMVCDAAVATDVAMIEAREEFLHRYRNRTEVEWTAPPVSVAESSNRSSYPSGGEDKHAVAPCLPMLASSCPGWVCYAEKTVPQALPYIATTKSPQQATAVILKAIIAQQKGVTLDSMYHATIMPCADKKLEGARLDFAHDDWDANEVDLVLTSAELLQFMERTAEESNQTVDDLFDGLPLTLDWTDRWEKMLNMCDDEGNLVSSASSYGNSGSGGWLEHIFRHATKQLYDVDLGSAPLRYVQGRNSDFQEVTLEVEGKVVLRFARAYGFRNIQNVTNKMKRKRGSNTPLYDYVEIMACPAGCVNGGGQVRVANEGPEATRQRNEKTSSVLHQALPRDLSGNPLVQFVYSEILESPRSVKALELLHTQYHNVPKLEESMPEVAAW